MYSKFPNDASQALAKSGCAEGPRMIFK